MTALGLDLLYLAPGATGGMETYARGLVPALACMRPDARLVAFTGRELGAELRADPWVDRIEVVALPVSSDTRLRRGLAEQVLLPRAIRRAGVEIVHSLGNTAPMRAAGGPPLVLTVHDLIWRRHPETATRLMNVGLRALVPRAVVRARRVIAVSQATATDLGDLLAVPDERIRVVPNGPGLSGGTPTPEDELRARLDLGDGPLVLSPSAPRPHKNLRRLVEAMAGVDATLVVPGYASIEEPGLRATARRARVRLAGWLSAEDMEGLYASATLLAFPSLAEGFGLPVLEAMKRGLPVACSDETSLPEVAGDAALLFDPRDVASIRSAVTRLLSDAVLRADLAARGRARAANFTWEACADATWAVYDEVLGER